MDLRCSSITFLIAACPPDSYRGELDDDLSCPPCSPGFGTGPAINGSITPDNIGCQCNNGNCTSGADHYNNNESHFIELNHSAARLLPIIFVPANIPPYYN